MKRLWHRFWIGFHRERAAKWSKKLDMLYRQRRLSSTQQALWDDRIAEEDIKADRHKAKLL